MRRFALAALLALSPLMARADAELLGSWRGLYNDPELGETTYTITFFEDGRFDLASQVEVVVDFWATMDMPEVLMEPVETMELHLEGTWRTSSDSLFLDISNLEVTVDGQDFFQVIIEATIQSLLEPARRNRVGSPRNVSYIIEATIQSLLLSFAEEEQREPTQEEKDGLVALVNLLLPDLEDEMIAELNEDIDGPYHIDGDRLTLMDSLEYEDLVLYRQGGAATAVKAASWGQVKRTPRP